MYVRSLSIQNLRSFDSAELSLCHPGDGVPSATGSVPHLENVTLLLGSNGAGKTSVLRAVALSTLAPALAMGSGYVPYALVRRTRGRAEEAARVKARVVLHEQDGEGESKEEEMEATLMASPRGYTDRFLIETKPPPWHLRLYDEESPAFLVLGYGATRRVETGPGSVESRAKERILRYRRVAGLFEEHVTLMPLAAWLPQVFRKNKKRHQEIVTLLNQLLPDMKMLGKWEDTEDPETLFQRGGAVLPYPALSDGYRAFICWVGDVLYHLNAICPKGQRLVDMRGVVLVDEVDLHLHPEWQRHLVPSLSSAFPLLQFVLTSHSPLVVGTLSSRNLLLLEEREKTGGVRATDVLTPDEELYGLSVDQILTSESFGLESTRDERFFNRLKDVADRAREGGPEEALRFMRMVAGGAAAEAAPLPTVTQREPLVLRGHEGGSVDVAWAPTGDRLASTADDKTVRVWDGNTGEVLRILQGHTGIVYSVAWDFTGRRLASSSEDGTIRVWDAETGQELRVLRGHEEPGFSVAWDSTGRRLASASDDQTVRVWNTETGQELRVLQGHEGGVYFVAWDPTGDRLATASVDQTLRVWDANTGKELLVLSGHEAEVLAVAWDASGGRLASGARDKTVRIWDGGTGKELSVLRGHDKYVHSVAWSPTGKLLASGSGDQTVRVWDGDTGRELLVLRGHEAAVLGVAWDAVGHRLASTSDDGTVRIWEIASTVGLLSPRTPPPAAPGPTPEKPAQKKPASKRTTKQTQARRKPSRGGTRKGP